MKHNQKQRYVQSKTTLGDVNKAIKKTKQAEIERTLLNNYELKQII